MATPLGLPVNTRRLVDVNLTNVVNMPNSGNTVNTAWLNLVQPGSNVGGANGLVAPAGQIQPAGPYVVTEKVLLNVQLTASSQAGNGNTVPGYTNVYLQQAPAYANGAVDTGNITNVPLRSNFATGNIPYTAQQCANAVANTYTTAVNIIDQLPPLIQQYIRLQVVAGTNATNNGADSTATIQLFF